jgi:hypothetical protein
VVHFLQEALLVMDMLQLLHLDDALLIHFLQGEVAPPIFPPHEVDPRQRACACAASNTLGEQCARPLWNELPEGASILTQYGEVVVSFRHRPH